MKTIKENVRFVWNGVKVNGVFYKGQYDLEVCGHPAGTLKIYLRGCSFPRNVPGIIVENESDIMTDYFDEDSLLIFPGSEHYKAACEAAKAFEIHSMKQAVKHSESMLAKRTGTSHEAFYRKELENRRKKLAALIAQ